MNINKYLEYHPEWQKKRVEYIFNKLGKEFFLNKKILELAPYNGFIGNSFKEIGADVTCVDGREDNCEFIREYYKLKTFCADLDTKEWPWGKFDVIINFGLLYHLKDNHEEVLVNCLRNCDLLIFETFINNLLDPKIVLREEKGPDQSLSGIGGTPSISYIENILNNNSCKYERILDMSNNGGHNYSGRANRSMWFINCK